VLCYNGGVNPRSIRHMSRSQMRSLGPDLRPRVSRLRVLGDGAHALGELLLVLGAAMCLPALVALWYGEIAELEAFGGAAVAVALLGWWLERSFPQKHMSWRAALVLCVAGWVLYSLTGGLPVWLSLGIPFVDAAFEATSGFTTTGFTVLTGIEDLPRSILLWRVEMQWLGGLGILSFFLLVSFPGGEAFRLLLVEGPKALVQRPSPGVRGTILILWRIYIGLTALNFLALLLLGAGGVNSLAYALSTSSTGGFGLHDANLGQFALAGHPHAYGIELVTIVFMLLSGISFLSHHLLLSGQPRSTLFGSETRTYWTMLAGTVLLLVVEGYMRTGPNVFSHGELPRRALFQSASLLSGAGLATTDFRHWLSFPAGLQALLFLMLTGGCVGSTSGGLKILRFRVLRLYAWHHVKRSTYPRRYVMPFRLGGTLIPEEEVNQMVVVAFCWLALTALGGVLTALFSHHGALESITVSLSAVSNMGPSLLTPTHLAAFPTALKAYYIVAMLAGRLEILPVLALFSRRVWQ